MTHPTNHDEYLQRFSLNQRMSSFGLNTTMHMPCPFCAAPDFLVYRVVEVQEAMGKGAVCKECGRGAKAVFIGHKGGISFEIVQTSGPDQPDWLEPKMRRES